MTAIATITPNFSPINIVLIDGGGIGATGTIIDRTDETVCIRWNRGGKSFWYSQVILSRVRTL